jgi:hypothetical protein
MADKKEKMRELIEFGNLSDSASDDLAFLEKELKSLTVEPLTAKETALLSERLDDGIARFRYQAFGLYRFVTRYAVSVAAVLLVVVMASMTKFKPAIQESAAPAVSEYAVESAVNEEDVIYSLVDDEDLSENLDDDYINTVVNAYVWKTGDDASGKLLDEISTEEYDYLLNSFNAEDML